MKNACKKYKLLYSLKSLLNLNKNLFHWTHSHLVGYSFTEYIFFDFFSFVYFFLRYFHRRYFFLLPSIMICQREYIFSNNFFRCILSWPIHTYDNYKTIILRHYTHIYFELYLIRLYFGRYNRSLFRSILTLIAVYERSIYHVLPRTRTIPHELSFTGICVESLSSRTGTKVDYPKNPTTNEHPT